MRCGDCADSRCDHTNELRTCVTYTKCSICAMWLATECICFSVFLCFSVFVGREFGSRIWSEANLGTFINLIEHASCSTRTCCQECKRTLHTDRKGPVEYDGPSNRDLWKLTIRDKHWKVQSNLLKMRVKYFENNFAFTYFSLCILKIL